jgi:hypothetical protein
LTSGCDGDLARAERIVGSITDPEWRNLGTDVIQAQRDAPPAVQTQTDNAPVEPPARDRQRSPIRSNEWRTC